MVVYGKINCSLQSMGKTKKSPCKYGSKCYRKSEEHLNGYSHPGDSEDVSNAIKHIVIL